MPELYSAKAKEKKTPLAKNPEEKPEVKAAPPLEKEKEAPKIKGLPLRDFLPPKSGHALSAWLVLPSKKVKFETQEPEEEILVILRKHWLTNLPWLLTAIILFLAPAVLRFFPLLEAFPFKFQLMFVVIWYLILLMYVFERFLAWFFNVAIITDERIIDVDFLNLTTKKVADADLDKIQDVAYTHFGAFGTIFNFGDVSVQTAAEQREFIFEKVPNPASVASILQRLRTEEKIEAIEGRVR
jgi:hypothetical protein